MDIFFTIAGSEIKVDGETLLVMTESDIVAVIK
jgi:co-chaperonin GroES (HSP10)